MSSFSFTPLLNISWKLINNLNRLLKKGQNLLGWLTFWYYLGFWPVLELKQLRTMILYEHLKLLNSYTFLYFVHQWSLVKFKFLPIFHSLIPVHYYIITAPPLSPVFPFPILPSEPCVNTYSNLKKSATLISSKSLFFELRLFENSPPQRAWFSLGPLSIHVPSFFPSINIYWSATDR